MTEQDYINTTTLAQLRIAKRLIDDVIPADTPGVTGDEHRTVVLTVRKWVDALSDAVQEAIV